MTFASTPAPLLAPTEALLCGFELAAPVPASAGAGAAPADDASRHPMQRREGFRIGNLHLMISYEDGSELTDLPSVYRLPNAPAWFLGMSNLHGTLVPVFDAADLFGVAHAGDAKPMLLVLGHGEDKAGLVIDGLPQRLRPTAQDRLDQATVPEALADCVTSVYRLDGLDWMDFRYQALFDHLVSDLTSRA